MLADSASRSGNVYQALQAYHKMGVVYDNQHKYEEAIQKYKQFLALCITSRNTQGEASYMASGGDSCKALAYNCLGIDCFKMGRGLAIDRSWKRPNEFLAVFGSSFRLRPFSLVEMPTPDMAYRLNGLPPFQVSFSITFPEGYYGKEKLDTSFHVEAEDSEVQVGP